MLRHLLRFFVLGLGLLGLKLAVFSAPIKPVLEVVVAAQATESEVERAIDEVVLVETALKRGGALLDPVVKDQLLLSMRVDTKAVSESEQMLLERAILLGIHRVDPVVRQRLLYQAEQLVMGRVRAQTPPDTELEAYLKAHAVRYREEARSSFAQAFVSRARRGAAIDDEVARLGGRLRDEAPPPELAFRYSDPTILPLHVRRASTRDVAATFGEGFAQGLERASPGSWEGPLTSSYGVHFVWVYEREPARLPSLTEIRSRLTADLLHDTRRARLQEEVRKLRSQYHVELTRL